MQQRSESYHSAHRKAIGIWVLSNRIAYHCQTFRNRQFERSIALGLKGLGRQQGAWSRTLLRTAQESVSITLVDVDGWTARIVSAGKAHSSEHV